MKRARLAACLARGPRGWNKGRNTHRFPAHQRNPHDVGPVEDRTCERGDRVMRRRGQFRLLERTIAIPPAVSGLPCAGSEEAIPSRVPVYARR